MLKKGKKEEKEAFDIRRRTDAESFSDNPQKTL